MASWQVNAKPMQTEKQPEDQHVQMENQLWGQQDEKEIEDHVGGFFAVDEELHGLGQPEWVSIEVVMDSGAVESVAPSDMAPLGAHQGVRRITGRLEVHLSQQ